MGEKNQYGNQLIATVKVINPDKLEQSPTIAYVVPPEVEAFTSGLTPLERELNRKPEGVNMGLLDFVHYGIIPNVDGTSDTFQTSLKISTDLNSQALSKIRVTAILYGPNGETDRRSVLYSTVSVKGEPPQMTIEEPIATIEPLIPETLQPESPQNQSQYSLIEEFDSNDGFTITEPGSIFIENGKVIWNLTQSVSKDQYIYREIPYFEGNYRLTVLGQINDHDGNHNVEIGISNTVGVGPNINFGYFGGALGLSHCPSSGYYIGARGVNLIPDETTGCDTVPIIRGTPFLVRMTIMNGIMDLEVEGMGKATGTTTYDEGFDTLWIGQEGGDNWPWASGTIDYVIIEQLGEEIDLNSPQPQAQSPQMINRIEMGHINTHSTRGTINQGEVHVYTYDIGSSGGYNKIAFYLINESGNFDPYMIVKARDMVLENDDTSIFINDPEYSNSARVPETEFFCLDRSQFTFTVDFEIVIKDAADTGTGDYKLELLPIFSSTDPNRCVSIFSQVNE